MYAVYSIYNECMYSTWNDLQRHFKVIGTVSTFVRSPGLLSLPETEEIGYTCFQRKIAENDLEGRSSSLVMAQFTRPLPTYHFLLAVCSNHVMCLSRIFAKAEVMRSGLSACHSVMPRAGLLQKLSADFIGTWYYDWAGLLIGGNN